MAIGGETTGWAIGLDGSDKIGGKIFTHIVIDPEGRAMGYFENKGVEITGIAEKRFGIEREEYWVIGVISVKNAY